VIYIYIYRIKKCFKNNKPNILVCDTVKRTSIWGMYRVAAECFLRTLHSAWVAQVDGWRMKGESCNTHTHTHKRERGLPFLKSTFYTALSFRAAATTVSHRSYQHFCFAQLVLVC
jgi:hypothetical protein